MNRWSTLILSLLVLCAISVCSLLAYATTFYPEPFPKSVEDSAVIVRGKIGTSYSDWGHDEAGAKRIYTLYDLQITEVLKGNLNPSSLTIRELGGEKDGIGMDVPGVSRYQPGEDVVILLKSQNREGSYDVRGMMMGKLNVVTDSEGKEYLDGPALPAQTTDQRGSEPSQRRWTLDSLRQLIRAQNPLPHPSYSPNPTIQNAPPKTPQISAPQLQIPSTEKELDQPPFSWGLWLGGIAIVLGIGIGIRWKMKRRSFDKHP